MKRVRVILCASLLAGCSPNHRFVVGTEGDATAARLELNGKSKIMTRSGTKFEGDWKPVDASGRIVVAFKDGRTVACRIGYITNGDDEPHEFSADHNKCFEFGPLE